jgi:hypothetical protein
MRAADAEPPLSDAHRKALQRAMFELETSSFATRLADYAGRPVDRALRLMPPVAGKRLNRAVEAAIMHSLKLAIGSLKPGSARPPARRTSSLLAVLSGGVGGFFGVAALPFELPLTTTLMLRAIADIARHCGEDLARLDARLACLEVFALGRRNSASGLDIGYYASRTLLARLTEEASAFLLERGAATASAPVVNRLVAEIAARFGIVVSERAAASAVPVLGALGGATVNGIFMNHFQRVAQGHFTVRRLERRYGADAIRRQYEQLLPHRLRTAS